MSGVITMRRAKYHFLQRDIPTRDVTVNLLQLESPSLGHLPDA